MRDSRWMIYNKDIRDLKDETNIDPRILTILANRDLDTREKVDKFLNPSLDKMYDPFLMKDMDKAVDLILDVIDKNGHIHIVGDYDQDGNSSVVSLLKGLGKLTDRLTYSIPDRLKDGYGINERLVDEAKDFGSDLIITCDNGIAAHKAIQYCQDQGMKIIVTDHHQVVIKDGRQVLPPAQAVVNPHRLDCPYPFKNLCGAGVAYKLIQALYLVLGIDLEEARSLLQFTAMGTICDVVDLLDENRIIAKEGLAQLNKSQNLGVKHLAQAASWDKEITSYALGFVLGPCINASGRLSTARLGVELFMEEDENKVRAYAEELVRLNEDRKDMTQRAYKALKDQLEKSGRFKNDVIVAYLEGVHESIVGIVAGRIKDDYHRPSLVFTDSNQEGLLKGSGRSIAGYNMFEKVGEVKDLTTSFGGHEMACGLSIEKDKFKEFDYRLNENSGLSKRDLQREVVIDLKEDVDELDFDFIKSLDDLGPFGKANPRPILADKGVNLLSFKLIGKKKNVLKLNFEKNGRIVEGISFSSGEDFYSYLSAKFGTTGYYNPRQLKKNLVDLVYKASINEFRGQRTIQLNLKDLRIAK